MFTQKNIKQKLQIIIAIKIPRTANPVRDFGRHRTKQPQQQKSMRIVMHARTAAGVGFSAMASFNLCQLLSPSDTAKKYPRSAPSTVNIFPMDLTKEYIT